MLRRTPPERKLARVAALRPLVEARIARGELDEAAVALDGLREAERLVGTTALRASADLAEGMLAAARGDADHARTLLEDAVDGFAGSGAPFETARARIELATSLVALDRGAAAEREVRTALDALVELGAKAEAERARRVLRAAGGARDGPTVLTARERQVLQLVADGLTNRQIAERLVVSEHTVHRHVTSFLRKLDVPSRTAAAAYAVRSGMLDSSG